MSATKVKRAISKSYYTCPKCDNPQLREIIWRAGGEYDVEICLCGFPETDPDIRFEREGDNEGKK
jgi:hypothetical protein